MEKYRIDCLHVLLSYICEERTKEEIIYFILIQMENNTRFRGVEGGVRLQLRRVLFILTSKSLCLRFSMCDNMQR